MDQTTSYQPFPMGDQVPLIINAALTGMVLNRERAPHLPVSSAQIISDAEACFTAGATVVHIHVRDEHGEPEWRKEAYAEVIPAIRARCNGIIICATTSGRSGKSLAQRTDVLALEGAARPDLASVTLGSLNFHDGASVNDIETVEALLHAMQEVGINPELEIFDTGMAYLAQRLAAKGLLPTPCYANLLLGAVNTAPGDARALLSIIDRLPQGTVWSAAGIGAFQLPVNAHAIFMGGHVRTGLEDNPDLDSRMRTPATNLQLVERVAALASIAGRELATPAQAREMIGLSRSTEQQSSFSTQGTSV